MKNNEGHTFLGPNIGLAKLIDELMHLIVSLDGKDFDDTNLIDLFDSQDVIVNGRLFLNIPYKGGCEGLFGRWVGWGM